MYSSVRRGVLEHPKHHAGYATEDAMFNARTWYITDEAWYFVLY